MKCPRVSAILIRSGTLKGTISPLRTVENVFDFLFIFFHTHFSCLSKNDKKKVQNYAFSHLIKLSNRLCVLVTGLDNNYYKILTQWLIVSHQSFLNDKPNLTLVMQI